MTITIEDILSVNPNHDFNMDAHFSLLKYMALDSPFLDLVDSVLHIEVKIGDISFRRKHGLRRRIFEKSIH